MAEDVITKLQTEIKNLNISLKQFTKACNQQNNTKQLINHDIERIEQNLPGLNKVLDIIIETESKIDNVSNSFKKLKIFISDAKEKKYHYKEDFIQYLNNMDDKQFSYIKIKALYQFIFITIVLFVY